MISPGQLMMHTVGEVGSNAVIDLHNPLKKEDFNYNKDENQEFPKTLERVNVCVQNLINRVIKEVVPSKTFESLLFMANIALLPAVYNATSLKLFMTYLTLTSVPTFLFLFRIYSALQTHGVFGPLVGGIRQIGNNFAMAVLELPETKKPDEEIGLDGQISQEQINRRNVLHNHNEERRLPAEKMYTIRRRWFIGAVLITLSWVVAPRIPIVGRVVNWFMNGGIAWDLMVKGISVASIIYGLVWSYLIVYNNAKLRGANVNIIVDSTTKSSGVSTGNLVSVPEEEEEEEVEGEEEEEEIELDENEKNRTINSLKEQVIDLTRKNKELRDQRTNEITEFGKNVSEMYACFGKMYDEGVVKKNMLTNKVEELAKENEELERRLMLFQKKVQSFEKTNSKLSETLVNERKELEKYRKKEQKRKRLEKQLIELDESDEEED